MNIKSFNQILPLEALSWLAELVSLLQMTLTALLKGIDVANSDNGVRMGQIQLRFRVRCRSEFDRAPRNLVRWFGGAGLSGSGYRPAANISDCRGWHRW